MTERPENNASTAEPVEIRTGEGIIRVKFPGLFASGDDHVPHTLMERLFRSSAVQAVAVDRQHATIEIQYDRAAMDCRSALRTFSESLTDAGSGTETSLVRQYLDRVPGRVTRVERRIPDVTNLEPVGLPTNASRPDVPSQNQAESGTATGLPADALLFVENLVVEYDSEAEAGGRLGTGPTGSPRHTVSQQLSVAGSLPADVTKPWVGEVVIGGVRRIVNLTAAGGCLVMSIVGVVTPGIPTVPFVLATGYFLARSSPRLHARFRRSRFFGTMVSDYEDHGGLRWSTKFKMILFTVGLIVVTVVIAGATLPLLIAVGTMGTIGIYFLGRIPTVKGGDRAAGLAPATA